MSSEAPDRTAVDNSMSKDQVGCKKAGKKKIKKGLKRKVKVPPQWPGVIPATRRITIGGMSTP